MIRIWKLGDFTQKTIVCEFGVIVYRLVSPTTDQLFY
jgi:hypothetical protein